MIKRLQKILSTEMQMILDAMITGCKEPLFLVGGPVRDLLLNRKIVDLDVAVEGSPEELCRRLTETLGGTITVHPRFYTAKIRFPNGCVVDVAQTRKERYPEPARLPMVDPRATLVEDLARRDFTIQAMALQLSGAGAGRTVDPFNGRTDLKKKIIRILHPDSFRDDPVRAFRAVRYAARYGFRLDATTSAALQDLLARPDLLRTASDRIFDEWRRTFEEQHWIKAVQMLCKQKLLAWMSIRSFPAVNRLQRVDRSFNVIRRLLHSTDVSPSAGPTPWSVRWMAFLSLYPQRVRLQVAANMPFPRQIKKAFGAPVSVGQRLNALNRRVLLPSRIVQLLTDIPPEWIVVLHSQSGVRGQNRILHYVSVLRHIPPPATGEDLRRWGIPPGPVYPRLLKKLHAAKLDGRINTPEDIQRIVSRA